jgi:hypothetical protein
MVDAFEGLTRGHDLKILFMRFAILSFLSLVLITTTKA